MLQGLWTGEYLRIVLPELRTEIAFFPFPELIANRTLMEPAFRERRGREVLAIFELSKGYLFAVQSGPVVVLKGLRIQLFNHPKAAELSLRAIPMAVMVAILGGEFAFGEHVNRLNAGHYLDREGENGFPAGLGLLLVVQVEARGRCVPHAGQSAQVVVHLIKEIGLAATGEVEEEHAGTRTPPDIGAPEHSADPGTEEIRQAHCVHVSDRRRPLNHDGVAPSVA